MMYSKCCIKLGDPVMTERGLTRRVSLRLDGGTEMERGGPPPAQSAQCPRPSG